MVKPSTPKKPTMLFQLLVNFVIPIFILSKYSSESQLGPTKAMLLALAFPVAYELYSIWKRRKISILSVVAIAGIAITGAISLLGLSEGWLALRRSIPYFAIALALLISMHFKRPLLDLMLAQVVEMSEIEKYAKAKNESLNVKRLFKQANLLFAVLFIVVGIASYVLTRVIINSQTGTESFNSEFARLRVLSLPFITAPILVGSVSIIMFLLSILEKLTGLSTEALMKKKSTS